MDDLIRETVEGESSEHDSSATSTNANNSFDYERGVQEIDYSEVDCVTLGPSSNQNLHSSDDLAVEDGNVYEEHEFNFDDDDDDDNNHNSLVVNESGDDEEMLFHEYDEKTDVEEVDSVMQEEEGEDEDEVNVKIPAHAFKTPTLTGQVINLTEDDNDVPTVSADLVVEENPVPEAIETPAQDTKPDTSNVETNGHPVEAASVKTELNDQKDVIVEDAASSVKTEPPNANADTLGMAKRVPFSPCIRNGCPNLGVVSPDWEEEYCSTICAILHCKATFRSWTISNIAAAAAVHN